MANTVRAQAPSFQLLLLLLLFVPPVEVFVLRTLSLKSPCE